MAIEDSFKRLDIMKDIDYFHRDTYERLARSNRFVPLTNLECWDNLGTAKLSSLNTICEMN